MVVAESPLPVVAIAGIGLANIAAVAACGPACAAVCSDAIRADDVEARARALVAAFEQGAASR
jgi:thiamine-phosphate pyrophosphorylase